MLKNLLSKLAPLSPRGRCNRLTWWIVTILLTSLCQIPAILGLLLLFQESVVSRTAGILLIVFFGIIGIWLPFMIAARRFRDVGYSPWLCLLYLIPPIDGDELYLSWIPVFIICGFFRSKGPRRNKKVTRSVTKETPRHKC
ncbi:MAG: DUF805 domain-containing protein [Akkermansiaceae bacterium]